MAARPLQSAGPLLRCWPRSRRARLAQKRVGEAPARPARERCQDKTRSRARTTDVCIVLTCVAQQCSTLPPLRSCFLLLLKRCWTNGCCGAPAVCSAPPEPARAPAPHALTTTSDGGSRTAYASSTAVVCGHSCLCFPPSRPPSTRCFWRRRSWAQQAATAAQRRPPRVAGLRLPFPRRGRLRPTPAQRQHPGSSAEKYDCRGVGARSRRLCCF